MNTPIFEESVAMVTTNTKEKTPYRKVRNFLMNQQSVFGQRVKRQQFFVTFSIIFICISYQGRRL
ncbi:hypothetical protein HOLleu_01937 [Holothuria leucospilota]|uniref:Uncharacterized protein n=1 Tax=Holothuria leucospilota TaxID=206669 RepID=A0A9Q1HJH5_HOLLE|nr:hypothetical protein HOLleu_01937 [Holothuria leucospilota]